MSILQISIEMLIPYSASPPEFGNHDESRLEIDLHHVILQSPCRMRDMAAHSAKEFEI
jgi:hypothetical protein